MSEETTTVATGVTPDRVILAVVAIGILIFGAGLLGEWSKPVTVDDPVAYVQGLYDSGDPDTLDAAINYAVIDATGTTRQEVAGYILQAVSSPAEVVAGDTLVVGGVEVPSVLARSAGSQVPWCVLPDGSLLVGCVVGEVPVSVEADGARVSIDVLGNLVDPTGAFVQALITVEDGEFTVPDPLDITIDGPWELADVFLLDLFGGGAPLAPGDVVAAGSQLGVRLQMQHTLVRGVDDPPTEGAGDELVAGTVTIRFAEGAVTIRTGTPIIYVAGAR